MPDFRLEAPFQPTGDALALWPEDDPELPQLLYRHADALYLAADERALAALEDARDALLVAGDRETAAAAEISLSRIWWHRGRKDKTTEHETRAEELAGKEQSPATAHVVANIARTRFIAGIVDDGLRLATEALEMAEALGIEQLRAHALTTIGLARASVGDTAGGVRDVERALEIAIAANTAEAGSIANNLAVVTFFAFDFRRAAALFDEGLALAERFGDASGVRWLRAQQAVTAMTLGRWNESLPGLDEFIDGCEQGSPHYLEAFARVYRGHVREARNDRDDALADFQRALVVGRDAGDPQSLMPALGALAGALETRGRVAEARALAAELVELCRAHPGEAAILLPFNFLVTRVAAEFEPQLRETLETASLVAWRELALACLDRDFVRAAEMWAAGGSQTGEALLRLHAAEELIGAGRRSEGEVELRKALEFYRSVGASFYIARGEQLLAKTA